MPSLSTKPGTSTIVTHYRFDSIHATLLIPFGKQDGFSIGLRSTGTKTQETFSSGSLQGRVDSPFDQTFAVRRALSQAVPHPIVPAGAPGESKTECRLRSNRDESLGIPY